MLGHPGRGAARVAGAVDRAPRAGFVRGLFSGGTLCDEAMAIAAERLGPIASEHPARAGLGARRRTCTPPTHLMIDFGDDRLTQGRPHPMIDQSLRLERIAEEAADPDCAVAPARRRARLRLPRRPGRRARARHRGGPRAAAATDGRDLAVVCLLVGSSERSAGPRRAQRTRWPPPARACTCPTPRPPGPRSRSWKEELTMADPRPRRGTRVVATVGAALFADALRAQAAEAIAVRLDAPGRRASEEATGDRRRRPPDAGRPTRRPRAG